MPGASRLFVARLSCATILTGFVLGQTRPFRFPACTSAINLAATSARAALPITNLRISISFCLYFLLALCRKRYVRQSPTLYHADTNRFGILFEGHKSHRILKHFLTSVEVFDLHGIPYSAPVVMDDHALKLAQFHGEMLDIISLYCCSVSRLP